MYNKTRYQIFVSSTFADLEEERGKVMETILNYDCFPAGMEMFPAMDEENLNISSESLMTAIIIC